MGDNSSMLWTPTNSPAFLYVAHVLPQWKDGGRPKREKELICSSRKNEKRLAVNNTKEKQKRYMKGSGVEDEERRGVSRTRRQNDKWFCSVYWNHLDGRLAKTERVYIYIYTYVCTVCNVVTCMYVLLSLVTCAGAGRRGGCMVS